MKKYIMKLAGWDICYVFVKVDWEASFKAIKNIGGSKKMTIFKMEFDLLAAFQRRSKI
jgi:hypothetical protein